MIYIYPHYFEKFKCVAGDCVDSCCAEWQIVIDEESLDAYLNYTGQYRDTLHRNIDWKQGVFGHNCHGKCAFLREDKLCDLYLHMGKESLCTTCREYPRHTEEFENVREISLSLSCPEVARILMHMTQPVSFVMKEDEQEEVFEDFDYFLFSNLEDIREALLKIIQNREEDMDSRIKKVLQIGACAQRHYDAGDLVHWEDVGDEDAVIIRDEYVLFKKQFLFLSEELELLYDDWEQVLVESKMYLFEAGSDAFYKHKHDFLVWWKKSSLPPMEIVCEQLLVYYISIYLLGAVYDENIIGKVDASVGHVIEIFLLLLARWEKKQEYLDMEDMIEIVYRYSREIEHSDENLEQVEILNWFDRLYG